MVASSLSELPWSSPAAVVCEAGSEKAARSGEPSASDAALSASESRRTSAGADWDDGRAPPAGVESEARYWLACCRRFGSGISASSNACVEGGRSGWGSDLSCAAAKQGRGGAGRRTSMHTSTPSWFSPVSTSSPGSGCWPTPLSTGQSNELPICRRRARSRGKGRGSNSMSASAQRGRTEVGHARRSPARPRARASARRSRAAPLQTGPSCAGRRRRRRRRRAAGGGPRTPRRALCARARGRGSVCCLADEEEQREDGAERGNAPMTRNTL